MVGLSPDLPEVLAKTATEQGLTFELLSDADLNMARAYGLAFQKTPTEPFLVPGVFFIGADGTVRFHYVNPDYRVRIDTGVLLAAAKALVQDTK